jgi:SAM-dependent methyltransferase
MLKGRAWASQVRRDWATAAKVWESWEPQLLYSLAAVDPHLIRALELAPGHRVLDFACGSGEPTLALAPLVAPGQVVGVDLSTPMLAIARKRARLRRAANVRFLRGDIARSRLPGRFDRVVARYGLMFVDDVPLTLERLWRALKPGGRIALAVWGPIERNPFFQVRAAAARPFLKAPPPDPEHFPGALRLARPGLMTRLLRQAGFRRVRACEAHVPMVLGGLDEYFEITFRVPGPMMDLYDALTRRQREALRRRLRRGIRPYLDGGLLRLPGCAWVVSGRREGQTATTPVSAAVRRLPRGRRRSASSPAS